MRRGAGPHSLRRQLDLTEQQTQASVWKEPGLTEDQSLMSVRNGAWPWWGAEPGLSEDWSRVPVESRAGSRPLRRELDLSAEWNQAH